MPEKDIFEKISTRGSARGSNRDGKSNFFATKKLKPKKGRKPVHDHSGCKHENGVCLKLGEYVTYRKEKKEEDKLNSG